MSERWPQRLLAWYADQKREMPWRGHGDPYAVWLSEIMLQQTQVAVVVPFFERFLQRFPTMSALATAPESDVLKLWEGLGYYSRARHLHAAAQQVAARPDGKLPPTAADLSELPGIGPYTAAAIASICFGEATPVVDGNVARVFARCLGWRDDFRLPAARRKLAAWLTPHIAGVPVPGDFNQAMMELGALVCTPRAPACPACPLRGTCIARQEGVQAELPVRPVQRHLPLRRAVAVVVRRRGRVLLAQRDRRGFLGGFWALPGGATATAAPSVRQVAALVRKQTGLAVAGLAGIGVWKQTFSHFRLELRVYACRQILGRLRPEQRLSLRWCSAADRQRLPVVMLHRRALGCTIWKTLRER